MDGTINGKSGQYVLLADYIVSSATTSVDFTGLNITKEDDYIFVSDWFNNGAGGSLYMYPNANYTDTNYYVQFLQVYGTSFQPVRGNSGLISYNDGNQKNLVISKIKLTNNGYYTSQNHAARNYANPSDVRIYEAYDTSTFTMTSITSLRLSGNIGIGSRFQLYKVGV